MITTHLRFADVVVLLSLAGGFTFLVLLLSWLATRTTRSVTGRLSRRVASRVVVGEIAGRLRNVGGFRSWN